MNPATEYITRSAAIARTPAPTIIPPLTGKVRLYRPEKYPRSIDTSSQLLGELKTFDPSQRSSLLPHRGTAAAQVEKSSFFELSSTLESIRDLRKLSAGWNGYDIPEPSEAAIEEALSWLATAYKEICSTHYRWRAPYVSADENGSVVLEWENGENGLAFYISGTDVHYLLDWGYDVEDEMEYGTLTNPSEISELWGRLNG